jgi:rhamnosyltransferase
VSDRGAAAVVVAYRPDPHRLRTLIRRLAPQVDALIVVDNSETATDRAAVAAAANGALLLSSGANEGVARAQNRGIRAALQAGAPFVLLFDDDSLPPPDLVERLLAGMRRAQRSGPPPAAVGPFAFDERDPAHALVYGNTRWGPRMVSVDYARGDQSAPVDAAFLLASGCLIDARALESVGPMREDLFIDHVDLEWGLRARRAGWGLYALADLPMPHRLGDRLLRLRWLGGRTVHVHSALRNYFLVRNTLLLVRGPLMPAGWRAGYLWWIAKYALFNAVCVPARLERARMVLRGVRDGLLGRAGPAPFPPSGA